MLDRFIGWLSMEPAAALLLLAAAAGIFISQFRRTPNKPFDRRLLEASAFALLLLGLAWGFRQLLNTTSDAFQATHGSPDALSDLIARDLWGVPVQQRELAISQQHEEEVQAQIPSKDPNAAPEFGMMKMLVTTPRYSITRFRGNVQLRLDEHEQNGQRYSGYLADVTLLYDIRNDTATETEMLFDLAMLYPYSSYQDVAVWVDDRAISPTLDAQRWQLTWRTRMKPGQASTVRVRYATSGTDFFLYEIPSDHPTGDSLLTIAVDRLPPAQVRPLPDGAAPTEIRPSADGRGSVLTWKLDRAPAWTTMGVSLSKAEQRGEQVLRALRRAPKIVVLLAGLLAATMLIGRGRVDFTDLGFFLLAFTMEFLAMAVFSDLLFGFWGGLVVGTLLALLMTFGWTRKTPDQREGQREIRWLLFALFAIFTLLAPLSNLLGTAAYQPYLLTSLVLFLLVLWIVTRRKPARAAQTA